jgi:hypothetical protein
MITMEGRVTDGKLFLHDRAEFDRRLGQVTGEVVVTVTPVSGVISTAQRRYYWGVVLPALAEHCGYTREEMHEAIKGMKHVAQTRTMTSAEFSRFVDEVVQWAYDAFDLAVPPPSTTPG